MRLTIKYIATLPVGYLETRKELRANSAATSVLNRFLSIAFGQTLRQCVQIQ